MKKLFTAALLLSLLCISQNAYAVAPLIEAIWKKDVAKVAKLINEGADVNVTHEDTALVEAVYSEPCQASTDILKLLINAKKIDVNKLSTRPMGSYSWCRTPLIAAAYLGNKEAVKQLLEKKAKVNLADTHVPGDDISGPQPLFTALHHAAAQRYPEIVTMLLDAGADIEQLSNTGLTPLMCSISCSNMSKKAEKEEAVKVITILLNRGAKVDSYPFSKYTKFLKVDLPEGTPSTVNPMGIIRGGGGYSALMFAAEQGFVEGAKLLLDKGANIELPCYGSKWTAIIIAANANKPEMVNYLVDRGAKIEAVDTMGTNALLTASSGLFHETVSVLLKRKANINAFIPILGFNSLMYAINQNPTVNEKEVLKMMNQLIEKGIDVNFQGAQGISALMIASGWGVVPPSTERAKLLLSKGAKVNVQNKKGESPLMLAAYRGHVKTAKLLIENGADIELKDKNGQTALMIASAAIIDLKNNNSDFPDLVKLLLDKGANVNVKDKKNNTAISLAAQYNHKKTVSLLSAKGAKDDGTAISEFSAKDIAGTWEGLQSSNPYDWHRYTFKTDNTWTYDITGTKEISKVMPGAEALKSYNATLKDRAKNMGNKGTFSFRGQFLVLKTNSVFSPERVLGWKVEKNKLNLNGTEFILTKTGK